MSKAYRVGIEDGLVWDVGGMDSIPREGWDEATINAMGSAWCRDAWGVPQGETGDDAWGEACHEYNRGVRDAIAGARSIDTRVVGGAVLSGTTREADAFCADSSEDPTLDLT